MKKSWRQKIAVFFLTILVGSLLLAQPVLAADVQLLPNAGGDYEVQTSPYEGQDYEVRTAALPGIITDTLGDLVNIAFGLAGDHLFKWLGDAAHGGVLVGYTALAGAGGGYCTAKPDDGTVVKDTCNEGYTATSRQGVEGVYFCYCKKQTAGMLNPGDFGITGTMGAMTVGLIDQSPPNLQTAHFIRETLANNLVTTPAYAQTGSSYFEAVVFVWRLTRNISYVFMVAILIGMGLMVMTRSQVDPRTVMTVTAALPRIATSIVLIAFSYPLAGFLVDIGRVIKALIDSQFQPLIAPAPMTVVEPFHLIGMLFDQISGVRFWDPVTWGFLGGSNIYLGGSGLSSYIIALGIRLILVVVAFMLFFTLVTRFASLFVQVIFAPFAFAWGALPGQEDTISRWFKSFAVNVLTFPAIYLLVNLATYIAEVSMSSSNPMPMPADLGWGTLGSWFGSTNVGGLVAFGLLIAATRVPAMLDDAFEVTAPAAVAKAGLEPGKVIGKLPVVGKIFG